MTKNEVLRAPILSLIDSDIAAIGNTFSRIAAFITVASSEEADMKLTARVFIYNPLF